MTLIIMGFKVIHILITGLTSLLLFSEQTSAKDMVLDPNANKVILSNAAFTNVHPEKFKGSTIYFTTYNIRYEASKNLSFELGTFLPFGALGLYPSVNYAAHVAPKLYVAVKANLGYSSLFIFDDVGGSDGFFSDITRHIFNTGISPIITLGDRQISVSASVPMWYVFDKDDKQFIYIPTIGLSYQFAKQFKANAELLLISTKGNFAETSVMNYGVRYFDTSSKLYVELSFMHVFDEEGEIFSNDGTFMEILGLPLLRVGTRF